MMACFCQIQLNREAFIIASLSPFFGNFLVSYTEQNLFWISIIPEEFCQTALDIVQRKVTIETVYHGADVVGFDVVAVDEKIHLEDSMPRVRGDSVGVTPILRHDQPFFLNNL